MGEPAPGGATRWPSRPIVQIAGIQDLAEGQMLTAAGVDWLGFPLRLAVHAPDLSEDDAAAIVRTLRPPHAAVLITYLDRAAEVVELCRRLGVRRVQLHGPVPVAELAAIKARDPGLLVIKSLVVRAASPADAPPALMALERELRAASPHVDAFITDTYDPATGASGATGKTHDWEVSRRLVALSPRPVLLAGGLVPGNVARAIHAVRPAGVDAHTGVEGPDGRKDPARVRAFVIAARAAFAATSA